MTDREQALLRHVDTLGERLVEWTAALVRIPTVNPYSGDSTAASEAAGQEWVAQRLQELGATVRRVPVPHDVYERGGFIGPADRKWDGRDNVVGEWLVGDGNGPCIILNNHMDTVGAEGMEFDPFDPVITDGRMRGRGASDTKGNLVMGLVAIEALLQHADTLNGKIIFESVVDEECNGGGAGAMACCLAGISGDFAICLDGPAGAINNGCNGVATARVLVRGRAGHSAEGEAVNAIDKAIVVKQAIDAFAQQRLSVFPTCHTNVGIFRSGTLPAVVPAEAELQINLCYDTTDARQSVARGHPWGGAMFRGRFEAAMNALADVDPWFRQQPVEVSWIKDLPPFYCDPSDPAISLAGEAASEVTGKPVEIEPMAAWTDACHLAEALKIPVLCMGAGTPGQAHSAHEHVRLDDLITGARIIALTLYRYFEGNR